ncbi:alpha/beta fold hydrolase [Candidatus Uabimicrobium sp. HlEnr_7]|uniref:alpha/beta fold hydrolase n=1 Tax=Candidatus Uabimicrobium helgolandensis TaxID=3095367 RepID=UPI003557E1AA
MSNSSFIQTPFLKIATKIYNRDQQKKLLAIHGWMDNAASFDRLLPLLDDYHSVAIDLPGHGRSQYRCLDGNYSFIHWPIDVAHCIETLGWEDLTLVGHSLGASIACFVAALVPSKVKRLFLIEGIGPLTKGSDDPITSLQKHMQDNSKYRIKKTPTYNNLEMLIEKRRSVGNLRYEDAKILIEGSLRPVEGGYQLSTDERLRTASPIRLTEEQVLSVLSKIRCPVVLFKAQNGLSYNEEQVAKRCEMIENLEIVEIPGSHHMHMEYPQKIAIYI